MVSLILKIGLLSTAGRCERMGLIHLFILASSQVLWEAYWFYTIFFYSSLFSESQEKLLDVYDRLEDMDADMAETKAAGILHGLGFTKQMMLKKCKDFSGRRLFSFSR